jgi:hypothetical protein
MSLLVAYIAVSTNFATVIKSEKMTVTENTDRVAEVKLRLSCDCYEGTGEVRVEVYIHTYIHTCIHTYIHTHKFTHTYITCITYIHTYIHYTHTCIHTLHTYIHKHIYIHT